MQGAQRFGNFNAQVTAGFTTTSQSNNLRLVTGEKVTAIATTSLAADELKARLRGKKSFSNQRSHSEF